MCGSYIATCVSPWPPQGVCLEVYPCAVPPWESEHVHFEHVEWRDSLDREPLLCCTYISPAAVTQFKFLVKSKLQFVTPH